MNNVFAIALFLLCVAVTARGSVVTDTVEYRLGDVVMRGFLARPEGDTARRAAVMVAHEWWGLNDYARSRAIQLAGLGYIALAADLYGEGRVAETPQEAGELAARMRNNPIALRARMNAALRYLRSRSDVDTVRIAAMGYCFGGACVLEAARSGTALAGVVSFHGTLGTRMPAGPRDISCPVLILTGADDPNVPPAQITAFREEMKRAGVEVQVIAYPGAVHGFTNPANGADNSRGVAYNATADRESWREMREFLARVFGEVHRAE